MRKIFLIFFCVFMAFLGEFFLFNLAGRWFMPNLLLLTIIYFNLAFGIRFSILAAVLAGLLKDGFSADVFGLNIFAFVVAAYMTTFLKRYLHYVASRRSRLLLVFFVITVNILTLSGLHVMLEKIDPGEIFRFVFIPETVVTLLVTSFVFLQLRKCASRLFV
ncbi:MAG TPA: rod shape-determining protein MreD [Candidatus Omnitrophota bacterium]|mgnify:CR=1 FL=1|nr:rod shape-determining protein MreD [Candidatus Omnitrophota bacterium]